jgi:hypothetical protein
MKHIAITLFSGIFLSMLAGCQDNGINDSCSQPNYTYNCDLIIRIVDEQGVNLISSGDYDPSLFRWEFKLDGRYKLAAYPGMYNQYLYTIEYEENQEHGPYICTPLHNLFEFRPTELRVDPDHPNIEYWTTDILLDYNYFDRSERQDTLRSVIRYEQYPECPRQVHWLEELYINGRPVWQEGVSDGAPEWIVVRESGEE